MVCLKRRNNFNNIALKASIKPITGIWASTCHHNPDCSSFRERLKQYGLSGSTSSFVYVKEFVYAPSCFISDKFFLLSSSSVFVIHPS